jgi:pyruvate dehydrogenase E1 component alpha subunit
VIYVCENNLYNQYTHFSETTAGDPLIRAAGFGVAAESVDGQDARAVYSTTAKLVDRARRGEGPAFLWANTYRFAGHHVGDISREYYRAKQEEQHWKAERDPIKVLRDWLTQQDVSAGVLDRMQSEVESEIQRAVQFATAAPYPDPSKVTEDVYA